MFLKLLSRVFGAMLCMAFVIPATPAAANTFHVTGQAQDSNTGDTVFTFDMNFSGALSPDNQPGSPVYYQITGPITGSFTGVADPSFSATITSLGAISMDDPCVNNLFSLKGFGILGASKFGVGCGLEVLLSNGSSAIFTSSFIPSDSATYITMDGTTTKDPALLTNVQDTTMTGNVSTVPEVSSASLVLTGLLTLCGAGLLRRRSLLTTA